MSTPIWITRAGNLGAFPENQFFEFALQAQNATEYRVISGTLPPGVQLTRAGVIAGIPVVTQTQPSEQVYDYVFVVRAASTTGSITDRGFVLTINTVQPPVIATRGPVLGEFEPGTYLDIPLSVIDSTPGELLTWTVSSGQLPSELQLTDSGRIEGYVLVNQTQDWVFAVTVRDRLDQDTVNYVIRTVFVPDPRPVITTRPQQLTTAKQDNHLSFQFSAFDFEDQTLEWFLDVGTETGYDSTGFDAVGYDKTIAILENLVLDPVTGWLHGYLPPVSGTQTLVLPVGVRQISTGRRSLIQDFELVITEYDTVESIRWITPSDLGEINNGSISEFFVQAESFGGQPVTYSLAPYSAQVPRLPINMPNGLRVDSSGEIQGRVSFRYWSLDNNTTTIDNGRTTWDEIHRFAVEARTADNSEIGVRVFQIRVVSRNRVPFDNVYIRALPSTTARQLLVNLVNDTDIVPNNIVYRPTDPYFGRVRELRMLFLAGVETPVLAQYATATELNHYRKWMTIAGLGVARAQALNTTDDIYEVVYATVRDNLENQDGRSTALEIDLVQKITNYYQVDGQPQTTAEPNSFDNMRTRLLLALDLESRGALPRWQTSVQRDGSVLGAARVIPLAYVKPGTGAVVVQKLLAQDQLQRTLNSGQDLSHLNFEFDRYQIDRQLSLYYDAAAGQFLQSQLTTFDRQRVGEVLFYQDAGSVDWAVTEPFDTINAVPLSVIQRRTLPTLLSPETFPVQHPSWSAWMNQHAVWVNAQTRALPNTVTVIVREFYVPIAGLYEITTMSSHSVIVTVNSSTVYSGTGVFGDPADSTVTVGLPQGRSTVTWTLSTPAGSQVWNNNPMGVGVVIVGSTGVVFDSALSINPLLGFAGQDPGGVFDGQTNISTGQTLVFAQQTQFPGREADFNQGWYRYTELFGDLFDALPFNAFDVVPGWVAAVSDPSQQTINQRAGVWEIDIDPITQLVTLNFQQQILPGQYVQVQKGQTFAQQNLLLESPPLPGQTDLYYRTLLRPDTALSTVFDGDSTRFIEFRDLYQDPGRQDKYIIYPKVGVFE
jgi:hypothetical protein